MLLARQQSKQETLKQGIAGTIRTLGEALTAVQAFDRGALDRSAADMTAASRSLKQAAGDAEKLESVAKWLGNGVILLGCIFAANGPVPFLLKPLAPEGSA